MNIVPTRLEQQINRCTSHLRLLLSIIVSVVVAAASSSCSTSTSQNTSQGSAGDEGTASSSSESGLRPNNYASIVGDNAPSCPSGQTVFAKVKGGAAAYTNDERGFLNGAIGQDVPSGYSMTPVYCSTVTEQSMLDAAKRSIAASPELCPAIKALPDGWVISFSGNSEPSYDFVDPAMKEWVAATDGGPTTQAFFNDEMTDKVASTSPADTRVDNRYYMVQQAIMAAADWLC